MKIKAADIARNLNLSKATVSLVLNNKPGVSEKTRRKVFDYIEEVTGEPEKQKEEKDKQNQELENKNIIIRTKYHSSEDNTRYFLCRGRSSGLLRLPH